MTRAAISFGLAAVLWMVAIDLVRQRVQEIRLVWTQNVLLCQAQCHEVGREFAIVQFAPGSCGCAGVLEPVEVVDAR